LTEFKKIKPSSTICYWKLKNRTYEKTSKFIGKLQESHTEKINIPWEREKQENYRKEIELGLEYVVWQIILSSSEALFKGLFSLWISDLDSMADIVLHSSLIQFVSFFVTNHLADIFFPILFQIFIFFFSLI